MELRKLTNSVFAKEDLDFIKACEKASIAVTARQASKYRNN